MVHDKIVNSFMKSITNRAFMAKKNKYQTPAIDVVYIGCMQNLLDASSAATTVTGGPLGGVSTIPDDPSTGR